MLPELIFASANDNKTAEIRDLLTGIYEVKNLNDLGFKEEIPETGNTLEENALIKARYVHRRTGKICFADDTGLEVESLEGRPGVHSARYAGEEKSAGKNMDRLLKELSDKNNRKACFKTVIALIDSSGTEHLFEGRIDGEITNERHGQQGFGYDPVFRPEGSDVTFAEMSREEKNKLSHRARAIEKLTKFLRSGSLS